MIARLHWQRDSRRACFLLGAVAAVGSFQWSELMMLVGFISPPLTRHSFRLVLRRGFGREQRANSLRERRVSQDGIAQRGIGQPGDDGNLN